MQVTSSFEHPQSFSLWTHEQDTDLFFRLIGDIYDTVLCPLGWPDILKRCAELLPGLSAALIAKGACGRDGNLFYHDGQIAPEYQQSYFEKYMNLDPMNTVQYFADIGVPVSTVDSMPYSEFTNTRFYNEWVRPQGIVDFISVQLERSPANAALFGIFRHERHGVADEDAKARIQFLAQHIRRAVAISRLVEFRTVEAASLADALDLISAAMILVDASGKVTHVNAAGQAMLSERDIMEVVSGKLFATDKTVNRELYETLGAAGRGDNALGSRTVSMTSRKGEDYLTHALPLTSGARKKAGVEYAANAAIFVRKAQVDAPPAPEVIAKLYGLTPSELRVLLAVFDAGGVTDIARMLGISVPTAKTHLRRLFEKTSTKRQADLVRLVAGYAAARA